MVAAPLEVTAWPFIAGPEEAPRQAIGLTWRDEGVGPPAEVRVDGVPQALAWAGTPGEPLRATAFVPLGDAERTVRLAVDAGGPTVEATCTVTPPRRWELFLVNHSHVDIGYTEYQDILADAHGDYVAQALDLMGATDHRPAAEQYRWTCEASWTVERFLARHPERADEFVRRAREGRMEVTALYVNLTDLFGAELLRRAVADAVELRERYGIEIVSACNYDVNGFGWALPAILQGIGVRYLDTAINETRALGVRPRPTVVRWAGPEGGEVLLWHSAGYLIGNKLLLHASRASAEPHVAAFLDTCARDGYPHDAMQLLMSGNFGDSMPPSVSVCDAVADWNRTWLWPRLRLATVREWFEHLEAAWPAEIPRWQLAWPDWWADGNGAALYEAALVRRTQARLADLDAQRARLRECGVELARLDAQYEMAWKRAMLFCEHTWGPYEAEIKPHSAAARGQWYNKASHAYAAAALADAIELEQAVAAATGGRVSARDTGLTNATLQGAPSGYLASGDPAAVLIFNPLPHRRDDMVRVHVPGHFSGGAPPRLRDAASGAVVPASVEGYPDEDIVNAKHFQVEFLARDLPARGYRVYLLEPGTEQDTTPARDSGTTVLENARVRVEIDPVSGAIQSIVHRGSGRELVQQGTPYRLNEAIYEQVASPDDRHAIATWRGIGDRNVQFERTSFGATRIEAGPETAYMRSLLAHAAGPHGMTLSTGIIIYEHTDRVDVVNTLNKPPITRGEALYHAFPLATESGQIYLAVAGGVVRPGLDQIPGTATDWHGIQDWFAVAVDDFAVVVASPDVSLVQCTGINTGRWHETMPPSNGLVMSWALNNYWFTNFPVHQSGAVTYHYSIAVQAGAFDPVRADRFGAELRHRAWGHAIRLAPTASLHDASPSGVLGISISGVRAGGPSRRHRGLPLDQP